MAKLPNFTGDPCHPLAHPMLGRAQNLFRGDLQAIIDTPAQQRWEWFMELADAGRVPEVRQTIRRMLSEVYADIEAWLALKRALQVSKARLK